MDRMPWQQVEGACRGCGRTDCSLVKQHKSETAYQTCLERTIGRMEKLVETVERLKRTRDIEHNKTRSAIRRAKHNRELMYAAERTRDKLQAHLIKSVEECEAAEAEIERLRAQLQKVKKQASP